MGAGTDAVCGKSVDGSKRYQDGCEKVVVGRAFGQRSYAIPA